MSGKETIQPVHWIIHHSQQFFLIEQAYYHQNNSQHYLDVL